MSEPKKQSAFKSPWVIGWISLVVVVLSVNAYMIYKAIGNNPGLVVEDFYERGQDYEENIVKKLNNNLKWSTVISAENIHYNKPGKIRFKITDKQNIKPALDSITLFAYRPADARLDFSGSMEPIREAESEFHYQTELTFPAKGVWDILVSATIKGQEVNFGKRIFVKD